METKRVAYNAARNDKFYMSAGPSSVTADARCPHVHSIKSTFRLYTWSGVTRCTMHACRGSQTFALPRNTTPLRVPINFTHAIAGPIASPQIPVTGTWDDHDYAANNQGKGYECAAASQNEFVTHFNVPPTDPRHPSHGPVQRKGVYAAHMFTKPGGGNGVHQINLDARYHRSPTFSDYGACEGAASDVLGAAQWAWLTKELGRKADVKIIASGIQVLPPVNRGRDLNQYCAYDGAGKTFDRAARDVGEGADHQGMGYEAWAELPQARTRLLKLAQKAINDGNAKHVVFISGDQHWGEIMAKKMPADAEHGAEQVLYEVTASGIDQHYDEPQPNSNRVRVRSADHQGTGLFDQECNFPFDHNGKTHTDCASTSAAGDPGLVDNSNCKCVGGSGYGNMCTADGHTTLWCYTTNDSTCADSVTGSGDWSELACHGSGGTTPGVATTWCSTRTTSGGKHVPGLWGNCLPESEELVPRSKQSYSDANTCTDQVHHTCTARANYGAVSVDWARSVVTLSVYTPHEIAPLASSIDIDLAGALPSPAVTTTPMHPQSTAQQPACTPQQPAATPARGQRALQDTLLESTCTSAHAKCKCVGGSGYGDRCSTAEHTSLWCYTTSDSTCADGVEGTGGDWWSELACT